MGILVARASGAFTLSSKTQLWDHGICAAACCTISRSGHAAPKARMYLRFRGDRPFMSGKVPLSCSRGLRRRYFCHPMRWVCLKVGTSTTSTTADAAGVAPSDSGGSPESGADDGPITEDAGDLVADVS